MYKKVLSVLLSFTLAVTLFPGGLLGASAPGHDTVTIQNEYVKVAVSKKNGGYVISTVEGDILKKSDNNVDLTHRGANFDTSFTSFRVDGDDLVFGTSGGSLTTDSTDISVTSTWTKGGMAYTQTITLVNNAVSEQLGTALITYAVKNGTASAAQVKSRVLIDTRLGDKDFGYYEVPRQYLGQGYEYFEFERTWEGGSMPADYFVRDNPYSASIVGYGVNSVFEDAKPYKMTFAHWANIAATKFDYTPDPSLNFTNPINDEKTGDSAAALYYDLGVIEAGGEKSFSTYYGVTANLKNQNNDVLINTTAPTVLTLNQDKTAFVGTSGTDDGIVRINTTITNPQNSAKTYSNLAVVVYANGFTTQRRTDGGGWVTYDNTVPVYSDVINFAPGESRTTYFDFKFTPREGAELGGFVTKVFNMDTAVNDLGYYAEDFCLGTTENFVVIPGTNPALPAITLNDLQPKILYNNEIRYMTVVGRGVNFFNASQLNKIELRGDNGITYEVPIANLTVEQPKDGGSPINASILVDEYMVPGRYQLHFLWKSGANEEALQGIPDDFTSSAMTVFMTSDEAFRNDKYGVVAVTRDGNSYGVSAYKDETAFESAGIDKDNLLLCLRGAILKEKDGSYRLAGNNGDVNINNVLNYHGGSLTVEETNGTATVLMDGKLTSIGANTTVRDGTAMFRLENGTDYVVPTYTSNGEIVDGGSLSNGQDFIELKWNSMADVLTTIGGFLIDLRYGVLGKIQDAGNSSKTYNVISFGGGLDLSFMTPGGASAARENKSKNGSWTQSSKNSWQWDSTSQKYKPTGTGDIEPDKDDVDKPGGGVNIYDVLYGGKKPGYVGINMNAHIELPQIVAFLPNKIEGALDVNTIGLYRVGVDASAKTAIFEMHVSFVIKEAPSGAPVPDKLYFAIGGFEPGVNIDGMGVLWVTGGGGGFDNLYETIYGFDGVPPLKLLLHADFDVAKILTGAADLELSLRAISIRFSDLSLKMLEDAKFLEGGGIDLAWYPNFSLTADAKVNFLSIFTGQFQISAYSNADAAFFFEFMMRIALTLPDYIPIVGGMEIASMELGGGTEKVWGAIELLGFIRIGFTYYWTGDFEFTSGSSSGRESFSAAASNPGTAGFARTRALFASLSEPREVQYNAETQETQYMSVGSNLRFVAGSVVVDNVEAKISAANAAASPRMSLMSAAEPSISTNSERTTHFVQFTGAGDYIITISRPDNSEITAEYLKGHLTVTHGQSPYALMFYGDTDGNGGVYDNTTANVNVAGGVAYVIIPKADAENNKNFVFRFDDGKAHDVGAIYVEPLSGLTAYNASVSGSELTVGWAGENLSDTAVINVTLSEMKGTPGVIVKDGIKAGGTPPYVIALPETLAAGSYYVTLSLSDEGKSFNAYTINTPVSVTNPKAPAAPRSASISNAGNDMLKVTVTPGENAENDVNLDGYFIDVYEDGKLIDAGLYWAKEDIDKIIVGGRYDVPYVNNQGEPMTVDGKSFETLGYNPGSKYSVKVRAGNIETEQSGDVYYCSSPVTSGDVELKAATPPSVTVTYADGCVSVASDVAVTGTLYVNIDDCYDVSNAVLFTQETALPDGEHTFEFRGADADGDSVVVKEIISVDTTAPVIMLESPLGGAFTGNEIDLRGIVTDADADVQITVTINGEPVTLSPGAYEGGALACNLPLGGASEASNVTLEITAADAAGNSVTKIVQLTNSQSADIGEIVIYADGQALTDGRIILPGQGETAQIKVMGHLSDDTWIDVTDSDSVSLEVIGGISVSLAGNVVTARTEGQSLLSASFDLGGGRRLLNGAVALVGDVNLPTEKVAAPTASVPAGTVAAGIPVTLSCSVEGAEIFYTTDGTTPTSGSVKYSTPIVINQSVTIKAIAVKSGMIDSDVLDVSYTVEESPAKLVCTVKSMLAKVGKLQQIPFTWSGEPGALTFTSSNPAICAVTGDGTLVPMKAGIVVIIITPPDSPRVLFAVSVSA